MDQKDLKARTKRFALQILRIADQLPNTAKGRAVAGQLIHAGTSVAANYRAACRARSKSEFISKIGTVIEESDESAFWIELIQEDGMLDAERVVPLWREAGELVAIMTQSRKTAELNLRARKS